MAIYIILDDETKRKRIRKTIGSRSAKELDNTQEGLESIKQDKKPSIVIAEAPLDKKFIEQAKKHSPYVDFILLTDNAAESSDDATFVCETDCDEKIAEQVNAPFSRLNLIEQIHQETEDIKHTVSTIASRTKRRT